MNLRAEIRAFVESHESREPEELAEMFIRGCHVEDLLPLLVDEFKWVVRNNVRVEEIATLRQAAPIRAARHAESLAFALDAFDRLLDKPYRIGDGEARLFGDLTVEEHRTRVLMLRANIMGLERDVQLHEQAIAVIEKHAVSCLNDLARERMAA